MDKKNYNAVLFTNENKIKSSQPDYKGEIKIEGNNLNIAAWIKIAKNNKKYVSIAINSDYKKISKPSNSYVDTIGRAIDTKNLNSHHLPSSIRKSPINKRYKRPSIFANAKSLPPRNPSVMEGGSGGTKKTPPKYARYVKETFGTRSDYKKDRRSWKTNSR